MSDFSKNFLRERLGADALSAEYFGIFGKHPGWDDHIEDLPLPTESMALAKQLLYVQGIGSQISSGAWARLAPDARLPDFNHAFLWVRGSQFLAGRMWGSTDGKRRAHFPMVALFQGIDLPLEAAAAPMLARLEQVSADCRRTRSAATVRNVTADVSSGAPAACAQDGSPPRLTLGLARSSILNLARDLRGNLPPRCRLSADAGDYCRSLCFWTHFYSSLAPADTPLLFIAPIGEPWIDMLAREPGQGQFFCLRADLASLPLTYAPPPAEAIEEVDAAQLVKAVLAGKALPGWTWISRILGQG